MQQHRPGLPPHTQQQSTIRTTVEWVLGVVTLASLLLAIVFYFEAKSDAEAADRARSQAEAAARERELAEQVRDQYLFDLQREQQAAEAAALQADTLTLLLDAQAGAAILLASEYLEDCRTAMEGIETSPSLLGAIKGGYDPTSADEKYLQAIQYRQEGLPAEALQAATDAQADLRQCFRQLSFLANLASDGPLLEQ